MQVASLDSTTEDVEYERYHKFKTYRELSESSLGETAPGVLLRDRHDYFKKFHKHLKDAAWKVLKSENYDRNDLAQVMELFHALKITPRINKFPAAKSAEKIVQIEIDCEFDAFFADVESKIYTRVLDYFQDMLD